MDFHKDDKVVIRRGWEDEGQVGTVLGEAVWAGQWWTPVLWDDADDPDFHKTAGLVRFVPPPEPIEMRAVRQPNGEIHIFRQDGELYMVVLKQTTDAK